jgi:type VI secretion system secreted protein VgrG
VKIGGHHDKTIHGRFDIKAGKQIKSITPLHEMHGSERVIFKSRGGSIMIDSSGITLKGNVTIKGNVAITAGFGGGVAALDMQINKGDDFCVTCFLKKMGMDG